MQSLREFQQAKELWTRVLFYLNVAGRLHDLTSHLSYNFFFQCKRYGRFNYEWNQPATHKELIKTVSENDFNVQLVTQGHLKTRRMGNSKQVTDV